MFAFQIVIRLETIAPVERGYPDITFLISPGPASVAQLDVPSDWRQEVAGSTPTKVGNILLWRLIMKYFLRSFSPFR